MALSNEALAYNVKDWDGSPPFLGCVRPKVDVELCTCSELESVQTKVKNVADIWLKPLTFHKNNYMTYGECGVSSTSSPE